MRSLLTFLLFFAAQIAWAQMLPNLGFEKIDPATKLPEGWDTSFKRGGPAGYLTKTDSATATEGRFSLSIEADEAAVNLNFGACKMALPANFGGKTIELKGFLKTENIPVGSEENGAGLWMRIDGEEGPLEFDNMGDRAVQGSLDWKEYSIELNLDEEAKTIVFGGLISGKGKMWLDDLRLFVDGKPIAEAPVKIMKTYPAKADTAFSKASGVEIGKVSQQKVNDLALLGKVWGFLKYFHPTIAAGNLNWDKELFRFLPKFLASKNLKQRDQALLGWINSLGEVQPCADCSEKPDASAIPPPDLRWLDDATLNKNLSEKLRYVLKNRNQGKHYHIAHVAGTGNPQLKNEDSYKELKFPDDGYRLLALYRYWNIIQYWFPYRNVIGEDWNKVLEEYIPKMLEAPDALTYKLTATELIGRIHDTHANLWMQDEEIKNYKGRLRPAVQIKFIENKAVVTDYYHQEFGEKSGLLPGDIITAIDGVPVEDLVKKMLPGYPASNYPTQLRDIAKNLLRGNNPSMTLTVQREQPAVFQAVVQRYDAEIDKFNMGIDWGYNKPDSCYRLLNPDIGYIYFGNIKADLLPMIYEKFKNTKGIVIDIRNYPSAHVVFSLGQYFMPAPVDFVKFTTANVQFPGEFTFGDILQVGQNNPDYYKGKVAILINEISQSNAEFQTMAFRRAPQAKVFGSTTAGADGNVSSFQLPGGLNTMISGIGVFYPDGTPTQRVGIVPDIEVKPTIKGIKMGKDEVLEKAVEWLGKN